MEGLKLYNVHLKFRRELIITLLKIKRKPRNPETCALAQLFT